MYNFTSFRLNWLIFIVFCFSPSSLTGQTLFSQAGMRSLGLGGISVAMVDGFAVFNNPSLLPYTDNSASISVQNRFGISDLNIFQGAVSMKFNNSQSLGIGVMTSGIDGFSENHLMTGYGFKLQESLALGVKLCLTHYQLVERGNVFLPHADFGARYRVNTSLSLSMMYYNPLQINRIREYDDMFPTGVGIGATFDVGSSLFLHAEVSKMELMPIQFRFGIEWHWMERLWLRTGYSHTNSAYSLGFGLHWKSFTTNISFMHVALPGGISGADFSYRW